MKINCNIVIPQGYSATGEYRIPQIHELYLMGDTVSKAVTNNGVLSFFILEKDSVSVELPSYDGYEYTGEYRPVCLGELYNGRFSDCPSKWQYNNSSCESYFILKRVGQSIAKFSMGDVVKIICGPSIKVIITCNGERMVVLESKQKSFPIGTTLDTSQWKEWTGDFSSIG